MKNFYLLGGNSATLSAGYPLFAWGLNTSGQLGDGTLVNKSSPVKIGSSSWTKISAGTNFTLAIRNDGSLFGWGYYGDGQFGNNSSYAIWANTISPTLSWIQIATSDQACFYAIRSDGALFSWGLNTWGELGISSTVTSISSPVQVGTSSWAQIAAGAGYALGITSLGALYGWGQNGMGQCGTGIASSVLTSSPVKIGSSSWSKISAGPRASFGILTTGALYSWGYLYRGNLGTGITNLAPLSTNTGFSWSKVSVGKSYSLAIRSDGLLFGWGTKINQFWDPNDITQNGPQTTSPIQIGSSSWSQVSVGQDYQLAITSVGALYAWGLNTNGQWGDGSAIGGGSISPIKIGNSSWSQVVASGSTSYGISSTGGLYTWGLNASGQLGDGTIVDKSSPVKIGTSSWVQISAYADGNVLGITSTKALYGWGSNANGEIGDNTLVNKSSPVKIGSSSWNQVASGGGFSLGILSTGALYSWGYNGGGACADGGASRSSPVKVGSSSWTKVSASYTAGYGILTTGALFSWGVDLYGGQLGIGSVTHIVQSSPVQIGTSSWSQVSAGLDGVVLGLTTSGTNNLYSWGDDYYQTCASGVGTFSPVKIGSSSWSQVSTGQFHVIGIDTVGSLYGWGADNYNGNYNGLENGISSPVRIGTSSWSQISAGYQYTLAIRNDGALFSWGDNTYGQLGYTGAATYVPTLVSASSWTTIRASDYTSMGISSGNLYAWGYYNRNFGDMINQPYGSNVSSPTRIGSLSSWTDCAPNGNGSLGLTSGLGNFYTCGLSTYAGYNAYQSTPVKIGSLSWTQVSAGNGGALGITPNGSLYAWGSKYYMGDGNYYDSASPRKIGNSSWSQVSAGLQFALGLTAVGSFGVLYAWGYNAMGQLGDGTVVDKSSPVKIGSSSWSKIAAGVDTGYGITAVGALYAWGYNGYGQLGDGTVANKSSPIHVGALSWTNVWAGLGNFVVASRFVVGAVYAWGDNTYGQLGDGTVVSKSSPVQIGTQSWIQISVGVSSSYGIATSNTGLQTGALWAWGYNGNGELGDGTVGIHKSSPVKIGNLSSWTLVDAGGEQVLALTR
ncbi:Regulator of chromosome condensation, RCC1 [uncultured Caudovirales phage]|uniref:Regulator of chromosome condensation, RCC1 n=1 Tax=uncultured Caudovirales phage TaxID=2100421 RepID=A0A6J5LHV1_9CAUD|nr:Regulator of chromosome condensation, RCC1 [uncultured Caudovirales phage]